MNVSPIPTQAHFQPSKESELVVCISGPQAGVPGKPRGQTTVRFPVALQTVGLLLKFYVHFPFISTDDENDQYLSVSDYTMKMF